MDSSRKYTLAVAEAMPEKNYDFKPANTVWNFNELMNHIGYGIIWWTENYIRKQQTSWEPPAYKKTKDETISYLQQAYKSLEDALTKALFTEDLVNGFHATLDHITHHRGQATTYLRLQDITPPEYTY